MSARNPAAPLSVKSGDIFRVKVGGKGSRSVLGRVTKVGKSVVLNRIAREGDLFGKSNERHVIVALTADLVERMEMDNFYGEVVPFGKAKRHSCNHNVTE
jgi:hypothetical protein